MALHVYDGGTWKPVTQPKVRDEGAWKDAVAAWVRDAGTWKPFFTNTTEAAKFSPGVAVNAHQVSDQNVTDWNAQGIKYVRHTLYWNLHVSDSSYRTTFATAMGKLIAGGIRPLVVVHTAPTDLSTTATTAQRTQFAQDFGTFLAARAVEYPGCDWQLWNEMDTGWTTAFGYGSGLTIQQQGALYGTHFSIAASMLRLADPSAKVVTGGTGSVGPSLQQWYAGVASTVGTCLPDAICCHSYGEPPWFQIYDNSVYARAGFSTAVPLWITETGISLAGMSGAWGITGDTAVIERARQFRQVMSKAREQNVARLYWYVWEGTDGHEIVRSNGTYEPAALSFVEYSKTSVMFDKPGSYSWTVPAGVTQIRVSVQAGGGGGQAGGASSGYGGGAGSYVYGAKTAVTAGSTVSFTVGAGGTGGIVGGAAPTAGSNSTVTIGGNTITTYGGTVSGGVESTQPVVGITTTSAGAGRGPRGNSNGYGANLLFGAAGFPGGNDATQTGLPGTCGAGAGAGSPSATAGLRGNGGKGGDGFVLIEWGTLQLLPVLEGVNLGYDAPNASYNLQFTSKFENPNSRAGKVELWWHGITGTDEGGLLTSGTFAAGATSLALYHLRHQDFGLGNHEYRARVFFSLDGGTTYTDGPFPTANWVNL